MYIYKYIYKYKKIKLHRIIFFLKNLRIYLSNFPLITLHAEAMAQFLVHFCRNVSYCRELHCKYARDGIAPKRRLVSGVF